jgi:NAD(P)-dependent dehydrogenase (short-subunit alcohol dehydrogenase family)
VTAPLPLAGELAVVTGALGRLGPIWIEGLLEAGARVAGLDRPGSPPSDPFKSVRSHYDDTRLRIFECDITDRDGIAAARDGVVAAMGVPKVLVNNAGVDQPPDSGTGRFKIEDMPVEMFRRMVDVNLVGTFQVTQVFGALMTANGGGSIINIGSLYASVAPDQRFYDHFAGEPPFLKVPSYGASKAGVINMTKYFATVWGRQGVRVNTLSPGGVLGGQDAEFKRKYGERVPLGRLAEAADLKGPLVFLASNASSYVTGHELRVDGGFTAW